MSRRSSLSLCLLAGLWSCDEGVGAAPCGDPPATGCADDAGPPGDRGLPADASAAPSMTCTDIVLALDRGAIARCPDGARYSWRVDGREVLARVAPALVIGGEEITVEGWPQVTWVVDAAPFNDTVVITYAGHAVLPELVTTLTLADDVLRVSTTARADEALYVDALVTMTGGVGADPKALTDAGFVEAVDAPVREGAQIWLSASLLSARTSRPGTIASDGRVEAPINAEVAAGVSLAASARWVAGRLDDWARGGYIGPTGGVGPAPVWGWRTAAAHGAVVDVDAIAAERRALFEGARAIVEAPIDPIFSAAPWIVVDGLWAPALGEWVVDPALVEAVGDADLGLFWPAARVCPDAPAFEDSIDEHEPTGAACGALDPNLPAAQARVERARLALSAQGADGFWLPGAVFAAQVSARASGVPVPGLTTSFDRALGAPGAECAAAATAGPFPRSAECDAALRTLDAPAAAPRVAPAAGAQTLMTYLDVPALSPLPLTLSGPPGAARQRLVLTALGGGPMLIADAPSTVQPEAWDWVLTVRQHPEAFRAIPRLAADDWPPSRWDADTARVIFNFTDAPTTVTLGDDWIGARDLFDPQIEAAAAVSIPPNDVRVFVRPAQ